MSFSACCLLILWFFFFTSNSEIAETIYSALFFLVCFPSCIWQCYLHNQFHSSTVVIPLFMGRSGKLQWGRYLFFFSLKTSSAAYTGCNTGCCLGNWGTVSPSKKSLVLSSNIFILRELGTKALSSSFSSHKSLFITQTELRILSLLQNSSHLNSAWTVCNLLGCISQCFVCDIKPYHAFRGWISSEALWNHSDLLYGFIIGVLLP